MNNKEKKYISDQKQIAKKIDFFNKLENFTLENVANLLENHPEYLNMQEEKSGCTLLFKAVSAGNYDIVEFLLDLNADPDKQNIYGETPLHQAVENGNYKIINILLERGANPNIQQQDGESPMHIAAVRGEYKIIKLLMLFGASPFIYTFDGGLTPLDYARESGKAESFKVLKPLYDENISRNNIYHNNEQDNGFRTTKNSSSQFYKVKNEIDLVNPPVFEFSQPINNTSKHSSSNNNKFHNRHHSNFDIFNLNNLNFNKIKDLNQPILCTNLNNSINNNSNSNVQNNGKSNNIYYPDSFVSNNDSSHIEINQENEYRSKRRNRNKYYSEVNNNEIFKKNSFNLINNFDEGYCHYDKNYKKAFDTKNQNIIGEEKLSNLNGIKQANNVSLITNNKNQNEKQQNNNFTDNNLIKGKEAFISDKTINEHMMSEKASNSKNYGLNKKHSSKTIDEKGVFDTKKEFNYKNNLLISEDSNNFANSRNNILNYNELNTNELKNSSTKKINLSSKKDSLNNISNFINVNNNKMLMDVIDENINSLNTNTIESHFDEGIQSKIPNNLNFEFTERERVDDNAYTIKNLHRQNYQLSKEPSFEAAGGNLKYLDAENTISEIENSPFAILSENQDYKSINNFNGKIKENKNFIYANKFNSGNNNNNNVNESEENLSQNNIPHINTEENYDLSKRLSSDKIPNLDYENYIRNNFRNSNTLESEQLKELRELAETKGKLNNFINLNLNANNNINYSEINNNMNYDNYESELTQGDYSEQINIDNNYDYNNSNSVNVSNLNKNNKNNKSNLLLATPKDAKINPNSNSYSFLRNQTPNFFYSKGKIPTNNSNNGLSMQKLNSQESFGREFNENISNININKSSKAFENKINNNIQNFMNNKTNIYYNNNLNNYENDNNNLIKSIATSKAFVNDLPFNYNSNSNFNFSNVNMIKEPESMSHISNMNENDNESNYLNKRLDTKNFSLNYEDNRLITLKPEEYVDTFENKLDFTGITFNSTKNKNNKINGRQNYSTSQKHDFNYNYDYIENESNKGNEKEKNCAKNNKNNFDDNYIKKDKNSENSNKKRIANLSDDVYNMPLQQKKNKNYAISTSKINESYLEDALVEKNNSAKKHKNKFSEKFYDANRKPLAVFFSSKNDIGLQLNDKRFNETNEKSNLNTFANNFTNANEIISINQNFNVDNNDNIYETLNSDGDVVNINNNTFCSFNTDKRGKLFRQFNRSKRVSFDKQNSSKLTTRNGYNKGKHVRNDSYKNKLPFGNESYMTYRSEVDFTNSDSYKEIFGFLKQINLEDFTMNFMKNGFDDLNLLVNQINSDLAINDANLKDIGVACPGDRAKILIKLEEESRNFSFDIPANVYYSAGNFDKIRTAEILNDTKLTAIYNWLKAMKLDKFTRNFVINSYHSLDLLLIQMASKNPLNERVLDEELNIDKIGYRIRILNKLREDSKEFVEKLKNSTCITAAKGDSNRESCKCIVF